MKRLVLLCATALFSITLAIAAQQPPTGQPPTGQPPTGQPPQGAPPEGGRGQQGPQPPPKNLQVLPKDLTRQQVVQIMRGFTRGLGVRCPFCHVGEEGADLSTFDFTSDEKPTKKTARVMLKMITDVNSQLANVGEKPAGEPRVTCYTCHRGTNKPLTAPPQQPGAQAF
jgi:hypothetical protein